MPSLLELSIQLHQDLGSPDAPTVGVIQYFLRHHVTELNNLINTGYTIDGTDGSIGPDLGDQESAILKKMYMVYYYGTQIRSNLGAAAIDPVLEVSENGAIVRLTNRNAISLTYVQMKRFEQEELDNLVSFYRSNNATPQVIDGDDTDDVWYDGVNGIRSKTS